MIPMDKTNEGRRVELVYTGDTITDLKPGDKGTYRYVLKQTPPMGSQHCIKWDNGSTLSLLEGVDRFKFLEPEEGGLFSFTIHGKIDAYSEDRAEEKLHDLLSDQCTFEIKITGREE